MDWPLFAILLLLLFAGLGLLLGWYGYHDSQ